MKVNERTALIGHHVVLVPYRSEHIPTYHRWMTDPNLLKLTASEPLSLEQEIDMQRKWHDDEDKLTFIILARPAPSSNEPELQSLDIKADNIRDYPMVGDVNLFFSKNPPWPKGKEADDELEVECEVMVAEPEHRRKGLALSALKLLLNYASSPSQPLNIPPEKFLARISSTNKPSLNLFSKLGFIQSKYVEVFKETEMRWCYGADWLGNAERVVDEREKWWGCSMKVVEF